MAGNGLLSEMHCSQKCFSSVVVVMWVNVVLSTLVFFIRPFVTCSTVLLYYTNTFSMKLTVDLRIKSLIYICVPQLWVLFITYREKLFSSMLATDRGLEKHIFASVENNHKDPA